MTATKIVVDSKALRNAVAAVAPAVATSKALPTLRGVKITADKVGVTVEARNLDLRLTVQVAAKVIGRSGAVVINARALRSVLTRGLPAGDVTITFDAKRPSVSAGTTTVWFDALPVDEWPTSAPTTGATLSLTAEDVASIRRVGAVASTDWGRPILNAVSVADGFAVATDSYRLLTARISAVASRPLLLPLAAVKVLPDDGARLTVDGDRIAWSTDIGSGSARLIQGDYPKWAGLMVPHIASPLVINRQPFLAAALRAEAVTSLTNAAVPLLITKVAGGISLSARYDGEDIFADELVFDGQPTAPPIALNPRFLAEVLASIPGDRVRLSVRDPLKPVLITPDSDDDVLRALMMPVRVSESEMRRAS